MKEIAYIRSGSFYDDSRATKEVKTLIEAGYKVHIIGWDRDGHALEECKKIFGGNVTYSFYNKPINGVIGYKGIFKLLGFFSFVKNCLLEIASNLLAVHACDLDGGFGAYSVCKRKNIPLIYDIYDYYIDSHNIDGLLGRLIERQEIKLINHAQTTIICTEERKAQIVKATPKNVVIIYNSPDIEALTQKEIKYDYAYCGAFGSGRLIEEINRVYNDNSDLKFVFAGSGKHESEIIKNGKQFENFRFVGSISYDEVLDLESESAVISAIYNPNKRNHVLCAPNKFYEALALGKPLIVCEGTGIDRIVEKNNLGLVIRYNANEFYDALRYLLSNPNACVEMGKRGRVLYETIYSWRIMSNVLTSVYKAL